MPTINALDWTLTWTLTIETSAVKGSGIWPVPHHPKPTGVADLDLMESSEDLKSIVQPGFSLPILWLPYESSNLRTRALRAFDICGPWLSCSLPGQTELAHK